MAINEKPTAIKIPLLLSDVVALNNSMPPASPRNNIAAPWTVQKMTSEGIPGVISGKKTPASNAKITSR